MSSSQADRNLNAVSLIVGIPLAIVLFIWAGWITVTAFVGGQAPFFFVDFEGVNPIRGLFWLIIVDPLVLTVAYWVFMLVMLPIGALAAGIGRATDRK
jgi:hypothetical protein